MMILLMVIDLSSCAIKIKFDFADVDDVNQTISFVDAKFYGIYDNRQSVALFFEYTNNSEVDKCADDGFIVLVHQNGKFADPLSIAEEIEGAITPGMIVASGDKAQVAYLFILNGTAPLSVMTSDGQQFTIEYEHIGTVRLKEEQNIIQ